MSKRRKKTIPLSPLSASTPTGLLRKLIHDRFLRTYLLCAESHLTSSRYSSSCLQYARSRDSGIPQQFSMLVFINNYLRRHLQLILKKVTCVFKSPFHNWTGEEQANSIPCTIIHLTADPHSSTLGQERLSKTVKREREDHRCQ